MLFSNIDINKALSVTRDSDLSFMKEENRPFSETDRDIIAMHNIKTLDQCHANKARYRIRHGNHLGQKVAIVVVAETFIDKLFSYIPSSCLLKRRLSKPLKECLMSNHHIKDMTMNFLRFGGKIPNMSPADVSGSCVYNPWPHLPEALNSTCERDGSTLHSTDLTNNRVIHFYDKNSPHSIFSNMTKRENNKPLALVEMPGVVTTASCSEILFQAGKYHNNPSARKAILKKTSGTDACTIAQKKDSNGKYVEKADDGFFDDKRDIELMLKLVRTRAQQDQKFRKALVASGQISIYEISPSDTKWGCVAEKTSSGDFIYKGQNLLGQTLMQVRQEVINFKISEKSTEEVMRDRDIKQRSDKENSIEEDFHSQQYTSFCNYDNIAAAGYL